MSLKAPLKPLVYRWSVLAFDRFVSDSIEHVVELLKHLRGIFRDLLYAIESFVGMDRVQRL